jgi:hypothetical protein
VYCFSLILSALKWAAGIRVATHRVAIQTGQELGMGWYRIYFLDNNNSISRALALECANDDEAITRLESQLVPAELWQGARFVMRSKGSNLTQASVNQQARAVTSRKTDAD